MSNPVAAEYWKSIGDDWSRSVTAADRGDADISVSAREKLSMLPVERIVVTGMRGAGKSVIYKALVGLAGEKYRKTQKSKRVEGRKIKITRNGGTFRAKVFVLPGQRDVKPRTRTVERLFKHGNYPLGVIHVVNWGFDEVWEEDARPQILASAGEPGRSADLRGVCKYLRTQELEDFMRTSHLLRTAWTGHTDEIWFVIAVTKCDLYWRQIEDVREYYIPGDDPASDSYFAKELRLLIEQLEFPKFAVLPVSCVSDPFEFVGRIRADSGEFSENWRAALINRLLSRLGDFSVV
jgi:hypothetical protein